MGGLIFLIAVFAVTGPTVQVNTVDGSVTQGELQQLNGEKITLKTSEGDKILPIDHVLSVTPQTTPVASDEKPMAWIELIDGTKLTASEFEVEGGWANLNLGSDKTAKISTASIHKVRFSPPDDRASPIWPANAGADATSDLLVIRKKDQVDFMEGGIGDVTDSLVILKADGEKYPVKRSKIDGLIYYHKSADKLPETSCIIETSSGWRLNAKDLSFVDSSSTYPSDRFEVTTVSGDKLFFLSGDQITKLDFSIGKIAYLSDLEQASMQWTPYLDFGNAAPALAAYYAPRRDEGREHQSLRLAGKTYDKGLSLYSRTAIDFRVPAGHEKIQSHGRH